MANLKGGPRPPPAWLQVTAKGREGGIHVLQEEFFLVNI
jgi:hypothetical protein